MIAMGCFTLLSDSGLENKIHSLRKSNSKLNSLPIWLLMFSKALGNLQIFISNSNWLLVIFSFALTSCYMYDYYWDFGFTTVVQNAFSTYSKNRIFSIGIGFCSKKSWVGYSVTYQLNKKKINRILASYDVTTSVKTKKRTKELEGNFPRPKHPLEQLLHKLKLSLDTHTENVLGKGAWLSNKFPRWIGTELLSRV